MAGCSLEGMMLKLKLQYFGHLMQRVDSLEKTDAGMPACRAFVQQSFTKVKRDTESF